MPAKEAKRWKSEGKKRRITKKEYKRLRNKFEVEGLMAQNGFWNLAREKRITGERCHSQGRSAIREYEAMHEKNFLSSWLRQDLIRKERKVNERAGEEEENKRKRGGKEKGGEKEENGTVKRRCVNFNLAEAFDIFCQGEDLESCGGVSWSDVLDNLDVLSDCESESRAVVSAVLVVSDVLVSLSSVVTECFDDVVLDLEWQFVEPQSVFFLEGASVHWDGFSGNHERWWVTSKSTSAYQRKNHPVHATAKLAFVV